MDPPSRDAVMLAINHLMELVKYCLMYMQGTVCLEPRYCVVCCQTVLTVFAAPYRIV